MPVPPLSKILAVLRQHIYEVLGPADPVEVAEPHAIFRIVKIEHKKELYVTVDDYIEDPAVRDFFVVVKMLVDNQCIIYYSDSPGIPEELRGRYYVARWLNRDGGYFYAPYVPLIQTPIVLDPASFSPRKGILTRYSKKLLKKGG